MTGEDIKSDAQDTNQVMANLDRINFWSAVNVILMIVVGISQVRFILQVFKFHYFCRYSGSDG